VTCKILVHKQAVIEMLPRAAPVHAQIVSVQGVSAQFLKRLFL